MTACYCNVIMTCWSVQALAVSALLVFRGENSILVILYRRFEEWLACGH